MRFSELVMNFLRSTNASSASSHVLMYQVSRAMPTTSTSKPSSGSSIVSNPPASVSPELSMSGIWGDETDEHDEQRRDELDRRGDEREQRAAVRAGAHGLDAAHVDVGQAGHRLHGGAGPPRQGTGARPQASRHSPPAAQADPAARRSERRGRPARGSPAARVR